MATLTQNRNVLTDFFGTLLSYIEFIGYIFQEIFWELPRSFLHEVITNDGAYPNARRDERFIDTFHGEQVNR